MAPAVATSRAEPAEAAKIESKQPDGKQLANVELPPQLREAFVKLAQAQAKALEKSTWVGGGFAEEVRSQHYGEKDEAPVHGKATAEEAKALVNEGIAITPILFPVAEPDELN